MARSKVVSASNLAEFMRQVAANPGKTTLLDKKSSQELRNKLGNQIVAEQERIRKSVK